MAASSPIRTIEPAAKRWIGRFMPRYNMAIINENLRSRDKYDGKRKELYNCLLEIYNNGQDEEKARQNANRFVDDWDTFQCNLRIDLEPKKNSSNHNRNLKNTVISPNRNRKSIRKSKSIRIRNRSRSRSANRP